MSKLTEKQEQFCQEYVKDFNATQAYMRAYPDSGYTSAMTDGCRMLGNAKVEKRIEELKKELEKENKDIVSQLISKYKRIAFTPIIDLIEQSDIELEKGTLRSYHLQDLNSIPKELRDLIKGIKPHAQGWTVEFHDPMAAMEALRKMFGLDAPIKTALTDKNGEDKDINININIVDEH